MVDQLSSFEEEMLKLKDEINIDDTFLYEQVLVVSQDLIPSSVDIFNYFVADKVTLVFSLL